MADGALTEEEDTSQDVITPVQGRLVRVQFCIADSDLALLAALCTGQMFLPGKEGEDDIGTLWPIFAIFFCKPKIIFK